MVKLSDIKHYEEYIIEKRRDFHKHPETGFQEFRTSKVIKDELVKFGYDVIDSIGVTGMIGTLVGNKQGKTVLLRADIDALNMQEELTTDYKSVNDGVMHSCGHDTHTAMLLGTAKYFSEHKDELNGTLKLVFQAAEEGPMPGGGISFVKGGFLDDCDAVFGMHIVTRIESGHIAIKKGPAMAAPDEFKIKIIGTGTHASAPQTGVDPILVSAQVIQALQNIVSRQISPTDSAVISVCTINGGTAFNIIPEVVEMSGTIRTLNNTTRLDIFKRIDDVCKGICAMNNADYDLEIIKAYPPLINDPEMAQFVLDTAIEVLGEEYVEELTEPSMGGEDFSYFLETKPGAYMWLGAKKNNNDKVAYNHNPKFDPDESAFITGTLMHINVVKNFLK